MQHSTGKQSDAAKYERARRVANLALWTLSVQLRRLNGEEPEDKDFPLRRWSDFHFFIWALVRFRKACQIASKIPSIQTAMSTELNKFDSVLPNLIKMRDVAEHIEDYALSKGKDRTISRQSLEVGSFDGETWSWLEFEINCPKALSTCEEIFEILKASHSRVTSDT